MGLLDDAIREHLELKRLRGADPGVVAREEQDALGPIDRKNEVELDNLQRSNTGGSQGARESDSGSAPSPSSLTSSQETVEINMEAELIAGGDTEHEQDAPKQKYASPPTHSEHTHASTDEPLEWDGPSDRDDEHSGVAASKRGADPGVEEDHEAGEHVEDVLEETPDFLRDTPEQERLWFEQRPPRDFDFNE